MTERASRLTVAAAGCGMGFLAALTGAYFVEPIARADATALAGLRSLAEHPRIEALADVLAHSVDLPLLLAMLALIVAAGIAWGRIWQAAAAVVLVAVANVLTQLLKVAAAHPRYQSALGGAQLGAEAFPSGHATAAMSIVLAAVLVAPSRWRPPVAFAGACFAIAVSFSLLILGWHFPSDVLGAFLVVGAVTMLVLAGLVVAEARFQRTGVSLGLGGPRVGRVGRATATGSIAALTVVVVLFGLVYPGDVASYAAAQTTAVIAAIGVALASLGLVTGVTAELEAAA